MINPRSLSRLTNIDWDFAGSLSESAFSAIHWHPGRFASQLPASLIGILSSPEDVILDPFVGSGTTLVEAQRLGRHSIGIDLNPISCLVARAKTLSVSARTVERFVVEIQEDAVSSLASQRQLHRPSANGFEIPGSVQGRKWYTPRAIASLGALWALVRTYSGGRRLLAEAAFSALLLPVSRETRHWGYVCDNSTPKGNHDVDVLREFSETLRRFALAYNERDEDVVERLGSLEHLGHVRIIEGSTNSKLESLSAASVDLVVTSPPYFGVCDYAKSQRLSMEWFDQEIEAYRLQEIGARSKRHRASAREQYLNDISDTFKQLKRIVRPKGHVAVIIGESKSREPILSDFRTRMQISGFQLELDMNRRVSSQRRQAPSIRGEHVFILSL